MRTEEIGNGLYAPSPETKGFKTYLYEEIASYIRAGAFWEISPENYPGLDTRYVLESRLSAVLKNIEDSKTRMADFQRLTPVNISVQNGSVSVEGLKKNLADVQTEAIRIVELLNPLDNEVENDIMSHD